MNDYTIYSMNEPAKIANEHKKRYIERHKKRENWTSSGVHLTKGPKSEVGSRKSEVGSPEVRKSGSPKSGSPEVRSAASKFI